MTTKEKESQQLFESLRLPVRTLPNNEKLHKSVIVHDTMNGKWNYGNFIIFVFRWFLFLSPIIVSLLMFAQTWLLPFRLFAFIIKKKEGKIVKAAEIV